MCVTISSDWVSIIIFNRHIVCIYVSEEYDGEEREIVKLSVDLLHLPIVKTNLDDSKIETLRIHLRRDGDYVEQWIHNAHNQIVCVAYRG
ncbi:hypothetical protein L1887_13503 [Cichorium endivia]|nr:hypothetical protein L1887_13503 [Cichorium endivia]